MWPFIELLSYQAMLRVIDGLYPTFLSNIPDIFCERLTGDVKIHIFLRKAFHASLFLNILISISPNSSPLLEHFKYFSGLESTMLIN